MSDPPPPPPLTSHQYQGGSDIQNHPGQVSPPGEIGPPLPIPLTTSGGSDQNHSPSKTALPKFSKTIFACSTRHLPKQIPGKMKMNFEKPREVFLHNGLKNKNLSQVFHRYHHLGESKLSFSLIFQISDFSCFSPNFAGAVSVRWR
jgi:hypothetical protein